MRLYLHAGSIAPRADVLRRNPANHSSQ